MVIRYTPMWGITLLGRRMVRDQEASGLLFRFRHRRCIGNKPTHHESLYKNKATIPAGRLVVTDQAFPARLLLAAAAFLRRSRRFWRVVSCSSEVMSFFS